MFDQKKIEERESLLKEVDDMYLGENSAAGIINPALSLVACGPVITVITRGVYCPIPKFNK